MRFIKSDVITVLAVFIMCCVLQKSNAESLTAPNAPIADLYDNLLQREYAGPMVFPNHQVERKAQRSPSLRLRFGRSDPKMLNSIVTKRWFGDVNQKPIRSPSLRLRFGRRSDPNFPQMRRTLYDDLLEHELKLNSQKNSAISSDDSELLYDNDDEFDRVVRKPQRLRWGRSLPTNALDISDMDPQNDQWDQLDRKWQKWQNKTRWLLGLQKQYDNPVVERSMGSMEDNEDDHNENTSDTEFQREVRKPMRLRWGRSIGNAPSEKKIPLDATAAVTPKFEN